jgi:guanylate kinase
VIIVVSGPGGVGKGTVVRQLVGRDPRILLSRSWTTRSPRPGEDPDAYVFVDRRTFEERVAAGGFLEHAEFLGDLYGTPLPESVAGRDLLLEIDVQGAAQVVERYGDVLVVLLVAPSVAVQRQRLENRGDAPDQVARRVAHGEAEVAAGRALGAVEIVNDDLSATVDELVAVIETARAARAG